MTIKTEPTGKQIVGVCKKYSEAKNKMDNSLLRDRYTFDKQCTVNLKKFGYKCFSNGFITTYKIYKLKN